MDSARTVFALDLVQLLSIGLPLDRVGPHLRHAVRKSLRTRDPERMAVVARVVVSEMLRRGELLRVAIQDGAEVKKHFVLVNGDNRLLDLSVLENPPSVKLRYPEPYRDSSPLTLPPGFEEEMDTNGSDLNHADPSSAGIQGITSMLGAMEESQKIELGDPRSGENGVILGSILELLDKFTPQFHLQIMLFKEFSLHEPHLRVFTHENPNELAPWFATRLKGHSVWLTSNNQLPDEVVKSFSDRGREAIQTAVAVPLFDAKPEDKSLLNRDEAGLLFLVSDQAWTRDTMLRLASRLSRFVTTRWQQHKNVSQRIHVDTLTGLFNKGYFKGQLGLLMERARRNKSHLTLVYCDIDNFKPINDTYGHHVGDKILCMVARRLQEELRRIDQVCRWGGEEFTLILPDTDVDAALDVMQRLLNASFTETITHQNNPLELKVTLSYGVATFPDCASEQQELDRKADTIMYLSKDRGRNQCHFWSNDGNHLQLLPENTSP